MAAVGRQLIDAMPAANKAGVGAGLAMLEGLSLARYGRTLGRIPYERRSTLLEGVAGSGPAGSAAIDALKTVVLLAAGAEEFAERIGEIANAQPPVRPDPELALADPAGLARSRHDVIVIGSGAGGAFCARELARGGAEVLILEEGERWDSARIRATHPIQPLRRPLPRRRLDDRGRRAAHRPARRPRRGRHDSPQLRHLLPAAGCGRRALAQRPRGR